MEATPAPPKEAKKGIFKKSVKIPLYGGALTIVICDNISDFAGKQASEWVAYCEQDANRTILNFERDKLGYAIIAHEARHATDNIMRRIGCRPSEATKEPFAYLQQWIVGWVGRELEKANIEVNCY